MINLTRSERDFLEKGGAIWGIRMNAKKAWEIYRIAWEYMDTLSFSVSTEAAAIHWAYLLADLSLPRESVTLHHTIKRRYGDDQYPVLSSDLSDLQLSVCEPVIGSTTFSLLRSIFKLLKNPGYVSVIYFRFARQSLKGSRSPFRQS